MKEKKSFWDVIKLIFTWIVVLAAVGMMAFTIFSVTTFDRNNRAIFGYKLFIDLTDSMSPDYFNAGDIVIVKKVDDVSKIKAGDIIAYQSLMEGETYGKAITHMVRYTSADAEGKSAIKKLVEDKTAGIRFASNEDQFKIHFLTYGSATGSNDAVIVSEDFVLGQYVGRLPRVGYFFQYLKTPIGYIICILVPFLLLIGMQGLNCIKIFKKYKKEQTAALAAERASLEAERAESQRMMSEIMALKAQLAAQQAPQYAQPPMQGQAPQYVQPPMQGQAPQYAQPPMQEQAPQYAQPPMQGQAPQYVQPQAPTQAQRPTMPQYAQAQRPTVPQYAQAQRHAQAPKSAESPDDTTKFNS